MTGEEAEVLLRRTAEQLGEHFDAVQILASRPRDGGGTAGHKSGTGNWYARQGLAHEFIEEDKAQEHAVAIARIKSADG